ncbi:DUF3376 domain-containing protein [Agromyces sp. NPDC057679]|uniref:DUF3376 domain-containing protein n=1 Tax=Agromyces sp. NPDC057679 TaxID=3346207 RepID=UPI003670F8EC
MDEPNSEPGYIELRLEQGDARSEFRPVRLATTDGSDACADHGLAPWHGRSLRIALAMKGGLSLAVWIGGAIAELDLLRRIRIYRDGDRARALLYHIGHHADVMGGSAPMIDRAEHYARYLASRGYDRVEFDVLAGASAGGLNGVLYATSQRAGVGFDTILDTWLSTGSAWGLLQTGRPKAFDSVMRGDTYFWPEVATAIDTIARTKQSCEQLRARQVVIDLSATLIDAVDSSDRTTSEGRAQFRFVGDDADRGIDGRSVPDRRTGDGRYAADVARIAYAARSTSSFPAMFEPALIYSGSNPLENEHGWEQPIQAGGVRAIDTPDMRMVFNAHRADAISHPFRVVDGGLLDNIPIDRALNAVRDLPAEEHINRAIIYLDPSPKETDGLFRRPTAYESARPALTYRVGRAAGRFAPELRTTRTDVASRLVATGLASFRKRAVRESRDAEIEEVDSVRAAISVVKARNELLAVRMDGSAPSGRKRADAIRAYAYYRTTSDLELLTPALMHPGEWMLGTDLPMRPDLTAVNRVGMVHVETAFRIAAEDIQNEAREDSARHGSVLAGRQSLVDACLTALSWIRAIEHTAFQEGVLELLDDEVDREFGRAARRTLRARLNRLVFEARLNRDRAILSTLRSLQNLLQGRTLSADGAAQLGRAWLRYDTEPSGELSDIWNGLDAIVDELFELSAHVDRMQATTERWQRTPWSQLRRGPASQGFASQLPLIFGGNGIPQPISSVRFHRIGSDVQPASATQYRKLMEDQLLRGYRGALSRPVDELDAVTVHNYLEEGCLRSNAKLAGLRAANLAGFLSSDWRVNDWWWGRLDAAAGIVEFFDAMPAAPGKRRSVAGEQPPPAPVRPAAEVLGDVHDALLDQLARAKDSPLPPAPADRPHHDRIQAADRPPTPRALRERMVRGTQGLESLSDAYRTAIVSRTVRAVSSAMARGSGRASLARMAHWVFRPLGAIGPAVASRPRLTLLFAFLVCGALLIWPSPAWELPEPLEMADSVTFASTLVVSAVVVVAWLRLAAAIRSRRRRLRRILEHTTTKIRTRAVIAAAERRARTGRVVLDLLTIATGAAVIWVDLVYGIGTVLFWAALVTFLGVSAAAIHAAQTVPQTLAISRRGTIAAAVGAVVAVALTIGIRAFPFPEPSGRWDQAGWHALGAALIGTAVALTMLVGCYARRWLLVLPVALVALAAAIASAGATIAFSYAEFTTPVEQITEALLVGWIAGTVLWWAPWWRGYGTGPQDAPSDAVVDLDWPAVVAAPRTAAGTEAAQRRRPERRRQASRAAAPAT